MRDALQPVAINGDIECCREIEHVQGDNRDRNHQEQTERLQDQLNEFILVQVFPLAVEEAVHHLCEVTRQYSFQQDGKKNDEKGQEIIQYGIVEKDPVEDAIHQSGLSDKIIDSC